MVELHRLNYSLTDFSGGRKFWIYMVLQLVFGAWEIPKALSCN